ncbi:iron ABC transporter permease [Bosea sp. (in: a-proteobacteria)]|jgi:iron complex transport system permease protein|uniref:FecCD family ABC transporter permease n=1 Tax=Bosea sp. (in: a-proteobacteria) TaxID=1871050 RepID=UPI002DDD9A79|nr:iron ABC transporter permease [Bosea sp. (in: a-proteobacteria)]HEV2510784.1 iron ABC transporter permease [Bosea sp. (in: a-proteobacteria)]
MSEVRIVAGSAPAPPAPAGERGRTVALTTLGCLLALVAAWSVTLGAVRLPFSRVLDAVFAFDGSRDHLVIASIRLPRMLAGLLAGAGLAVAGAIMQAVTGNPLASPGLLGINAGAAFAVVIAIAAFGVGSGDIHVWHAFAGAVAAAVTVQALGSAGRSGGSPLRLVLAGAVLAGFLTSLTTVILIFDQGTLDAVRLWTAGTLSGRSMAQVAAVSPYILAGLVAALVLRRHVTTLSLGPDVARSLGQSLPIWRGLSLAIVILLAGGAVALAGPIGFIGLVVPHVARLCVGVDYRWIIPFSALGGALLLVVADTAGRMLLGSQSFPAGVTMALIGGPFFIWLARSRVGGR